MKRILSRHVFVCSLRHHPVLLFINLLFLPLYDDSNFSKTHRRYFGQPKLHFHSKFSLVMGMNLRVRVELQIDQFETMNTKVSHVGSRFRVNLKHPAEMDFDSDLFLKIRIRETFFLFHIFFLKRDLHFVKKSNRIE